MNLRDLLKIFVISMLPIVELRGAIPVGLALGVPFWLNYATCVAGNLLPVPFLIVCIRHILEWGAGLPKIGKWFGWFLERGRRKADRIGAYRLLGLFLFVRFPLPAPAPVRVR
jgi:uncharacterized membrane protein